MSVCLKCRHPFHTICVECLARDYYVTKDLELERERKALQLTHRPLAALKFEQTGIG